MISVTGITAGLGPRVMNLVESMAVGPTLKDSLKVKASLKHNGINLMKMRLHEQPSLRSMCFSVNDSDDDDDDDLPSGPLSLVSRPKRDVLRLAVHLVELICTVCICPPCSIV